MSIKFDKEVIKEMLKRKGSFSSLFENILTKNLVKKQWEDIHWEKIAFTVILGLGWLISHNFFFTWFSPLKYWHLTWNGVWLVYVAALTYGFARSQMAWFGTWDKLKDAVSILDLPLSFKIWGAFNAGLTEELVYRGFLIYFLFFAIVLMNFLLENVVMVLVLFLLIVALLGLCGWLGMKWWHFGVSLVVCSGLAWYFGAWVWLGSFHFPDVFLRFCEWIIFVLYPFVIKYYFWVVIVTLAVYLFAYDWTAKKMKIKISFAEIWLNSLFICLVAYAFPLAFKALINTPVLSDLGRWDRIIALSGFLVANAKFSDAHKSMGGICAQINSSLLGCFMMYVALTYGLAHAIVVHALYDAALYSGESFYRRMRNKKSDV